MLWGDEYLPPSISVPFLVTLANPPCILLSLVQTVRVGG